MTWAVKLLDKYQDYFWKDDLVLAVLEKNEEIEKEIKRRDIRTMDFYRKFKGDEQARAFRELVEAVKDVKQ